MMTEKLAKIIEEIVEKSIDAQSLTPETSLRDDLGLDSLNLAQLTVFIEDEYNVDIFEEGNVETVGQILEKIGNE